MAVAVQESWSPTPRADTRATLSKEVARYVLRPDDEEALEVAVEGLNEAIENLNKRTWEWAKEVQDITLVASDRDYTLETEFKKARGMEFLDTSDTPARVPRCYYVDWKTFITEHPRRSVDGTPRVYSIRNAHGDGILEFNRPPAATFVTTYPKARLHYYRRVARLATADSRPDVPMEVQTYLKWSAKATAASVYAPEKFAVALRMSSMHWEEIVADDHAQKDWD